MVLASLASSSTRCSALEVSRLLYPPADSGMACSIAIRSVESLPVSSSPVVLRPDRDHAAADIHTDRRRHDGTEGGDNRPDGGSLTQVSVGHQRQVRIDERHLAGHLGLASGAVVQNRCPVVQPLIDPLH